jgi:transcriptional regulator with XRE-family HTH domain
MPFTRFDETRDYGFADRALALRERAGLTQRTLAALLGVSGRAIQAWEAGLAYPGAAHLTQLIAFYVERAAFPVGREEEATALWEAVRAHAPHRTVPFDRRWFASLRGGAGPAGSAASLPPVPTAGAPRWDDWGEAPDVGAFYGRAQEVATLSRWVLADRCRLVGVLGMGGVGKTLLAARLARGGAAGTGCRRARTGARHLPLLGAAALLRRAMGAPIRPANALLRARCPRRAPRWATRPSQRPGRPGKRCTWSTSSPRPWQAHEEQSAKPGQDGVRTGT